MQFSTLLSSPYEVVSSKQPLAISQMVVVLWGLNYHYML